MGQDLDHEDQDCLEAARLILLHLGFAGEVALPVRKPPVRPIYARSLKQASRLLHVVYQREKGTLRGEWRINKGWRERLRLAGVDPVKLVVVDEYRWGHAWDQLQHVRFRLGEQQRRLNLAVTVPDAPRRMIVKKGQRKLSYEAVQKAQIASSEGVKKISLIPRLLPPH